MVPVVLTDASSRVAIPVFIDEIYHDNDGVLTAFGVYVGNNSAGHPLFVSYVISHESHTPNANLLRAALDTLAGSRVTWSSISEEANHAAHLGPNAMRRQALRGFPRGLVKGGLAILVAEIVSHVVRHAGRPHYYVPAHGSGPAFIADQDIRNIRV